MATATWCYTVQLGLEFASEEVETEEKTCAEVDAEVAAARAEKYGD